MQAICATRTVRRTHIFAKFNVGRIRAAGRDARVALAVEHDPALENEGHALILGIVANDHAVLLNRLAIELVALLAPEF